MALAAYDAANAACQAYGAELRRLYGRDAGDARYDGRGEATPHLRTLLNEKLRTGEAWRDAMRRQSA